MKSSFKWIASILGILIIVLILAIFFLRSKFLNASQQVYSLEPGRVEILTDSASLERGLILSVGCRGCHGVDYAGLDFFNDEKLGYLSSPNLTGGKGSATENYTDEDWIMALRHGLNPDGHPLMVMPSLSIGKMSDQDLGSLIGFMKQVEKSDKPLGETDFTFIAEVLIGAGAFGELYTYHKIDHDQVRNIDHIAVSDGLEYGAYMTRIYGCAECHSDEYNGGESADPQSPPASNITVNGNLGNWNLDQFISTMKTGTTPEGKTMNSAFMPWPGIGVHDTIELSALFNYLRSLPGLDDDPVLAKK